MSLLSVAFFRRGGPLLLLLAGCIITGPDKTLPSAEEDADGDGYLSGEDCNDANAAIHPGATEVCDAGDVDEDCNGVADSADSGVSDGITVYRDADADTFGDGTAPSIACEVTAGYAALSGDCDDADPRIHPEATEICDAADADEDCDGLADDADDSVDPATRTAVWADTDGDGDGDPASPATRCDLASGWSPNDTDCDDLSATVNPEAAEYCDGVDDDCDGQIDENDAVDAPNWYLDDDGDGYGDASIVKVQCAAPSGYVLDNLDCDDVSASRHPGADEFCNGKDDNCDGDTDEDAALDVVTWYGDSDGDGAGNPTDLAVDCDQPSGYVAPGTDCNDRDATIYPGATELCDAADVDEDCNGLADDADASATGKTNWYTDADGDGYGDAGAPIAACDRPSGAVADHSDCDDTSAIVNPLALEICDAANSDEDCDGATDDADSSVDTSGLLTWFQDSDGDGYGGATVTTRACDAPTGYSALSSDCDDNDGSRNPGAAEVCDGANTDEDCDGYADDSDSTATGKSTWYQDSDGDLYGGTTSVSRCDAPSGYALQSQDCDDLNVAVNPGETEDCATATDENCDGIGLCNALSTDADRLLYGGPNNYSAYAVEGVDLDGDGIRELVSSSMYANSTTGEIYIFKGGGSGDAATSSADQIFQGAQSADAAGARLARLGDVNGDGTEELAITAMYSDEGASNGGTIYVVSGLTGGTVSLSTAFAHYNGTIPNGTLTEVAPAGDFDGDGLDDVMIGQYLNNQAYIFSGVSSGTFTLSDATTTLNAVSTNDYFGARIASAGDQDGDGIDDVLVSATGATGTVYLFHGPLTGSVSASAADAARTGDSSTILGNTLAERAGDVNNDGYVDVLVGAYSYSADYAAWILPGPLTGTSLASTSGTRLRDQDSTSAFGNTLAIDGDFDGDGVNDVAVGDYFEGTGGYASGTTSIFFGPITKSLTQADADVSLDGVTSSQQFGTTVRYVGPQSGTTDELLIGSHYDSTQNSYGGVAYLFSVGSL